MTFNYLANLPCTQTRGRTGMEVNPLVFETSASTDSAIWASFSDCAAKVVLPIGICKHICKKFPGRKHKNLYTAIRFRHFIPLRAGNRPSLLHRWGIPNLQEYLRMQFQEQCHCQGRPLRDRKPNHILCKCTFSCLLFFNNVLFRKQIYVTFCSFQHFQKDFFKGFHPF